MFYSYWCAELICLLMPLGLNNFPKKRHGTRTASPLSAAFAFALAVVFAGPAKPPSAKISPRLSII